MVQPYNYSVDVPQTNVVPYMAAIGQSLANQLAQYQAVQEQQRQAAMMAERQRQMQMQFAQDMRAYTQDPSAQNYTMILTRYPQLKDQMAKAHEAMSEEQRQAQLAVIQPAYAAFSSGDIGTATQILAERRTALQNAGKMAQAQNVDRLIRSIDENPNAARMQLHMVLGGLLGPEKAAESFKMFEMMPTAMREAEAKADEAEQKAIAQQVTTERLPETLRLADEKTKTEIKNFISQISDRTNRTLVDSMKAVNEGAEKAAQLRLAEMEIPEWLHKETFMLSTNASVYGQTANKAYDLSIRFRTSDMPSGPIARWSKWLDDQFGTTDAAGALRKEYETLDTDRVIDKLSGLKGAATDKDVSLVKSTSLASISDKNQLADWLVGLAKMQSYARNRNILKTKFIERNGKKGLMGASGDFDIDGYNVSAGMTFNDFEDKYGEQIFRDAVQSLESRYLTGRSYMEGVDLSATEEEFSPSAFEGEGTFFPPEEE